MANLGVEYPIAGYVIRVHESSDKFNCSEIPNSCPSRKNQLFGNSEKLKKSLAIATAFMIQFAAFSVNEGRSSSEDVKNTESTTISHLLQVHANSVHDFYPAASGFFIA